MTDTVYEAWASGAGSGSRFEGSSLAVQGALLGSSDVARLRSALQAAESKLSASNIREQALLSALSKLLERDPDNYFVENCELNDRIRQLESFNRDKEKTNSDQRFEISRLRNEVTIQETKLQQLGVRIFRAKELLKDLGRVPGFNSTVREIVKLLDGRG
jgi:hypothetical protein